jgi:hypothetical protein
MFTPENFPDLMDTVGKVNFVLVGTCPAADSPDSLAKT